jgi:hypothetical protein
MMNIVEEIKMFWSPNFGDGEHYRKENAMYRRRELMRSEEYLLGLRNELAKLTHKVKDKESLETLEKIIGSIPI